MRHRQYPPHPILHECVKSLWTSERDFRPPLDTLELLPDSYIELVFSCGELYQLEDNQVFRRLPRCYLIGLLDQPLRLQAQGVVKSVAARFFAWGFSMLFDLSLQPLSAAIHQLDASWQTLTRQIEEAVQQDDGEAAIDHLHNFLIERALSRQFEQKTIQRTAQQLFEQTGQIKIDELANALNYSPRQIERKFKQSSGLSPKALARRIRFEKARDCLARDPSADPRRLAQDCGYADQAHFSREFKAFSHKTPAQFAREMQSLCDALHAEYHVVFLQD